MSLSREEKAKENRIRRAAKRRGFVLAKSTSRDPYAVEYGVYRLFLEGPDGQRDLIFKSRDLDEILTATETRK